MKYLNLHTNLLKDHKILADLQQAQTLYEDGTIIEAADICIEIAETIKMYADING